MNANANSAQRDNTLETPRAPAPRAFWIAAAAILLLAVLSRFVDLDYKAFHHDESLHAYYSHRVALGSPHEYSALLHGPFLYYFTGAVMWILGSGDYVARGAAALFGVLLVASPLLMRRFWGNAATLVLMALLLVSPTVWYFGRFLREDAFTSVWVIGTVFGGALFWRFRQPWQLYLAVAMLAFHFVNKENSYLHAFLWLLALAAMAVFSKWVAPRTPDMRKAYGGEAFSRSDRGYLALNSFSIFATIYILFYSSFFRHSKGSMHGILDGLYRESLLYWWDQNQKRRIDGPFDYHLPLLANYEFLVLPFVLVAWWRVVSVSRSVRSHAFNSAGAVAACVGLFLACFLLPRVAFVPDACSYTSVCLDTAAKGLGEITTALAKPIHIAHSRHLLQILAYVAFGGTAFFSALTLRRRFDAFLWFWLTGAFGVYSYVGEKVPWLTLYILVPLLVVVAMEAARLLTRAPLPCDADMFAEGATALEATARAESTLSKRLRIAAAAWVVVALPFTLFKGWRVSFVRPDDPAERLVFTQTTHDVKRVRDRWRAIAATKVKGTRFKVSMYGDATWPFAWYTEEFGAGDFAKPTPETAKNLDVILVDHSTLGQARKDFAEFHAYELPLRHWWVPGQDPSLAQIMRYFFTGEVYVRTPASGPEDTGVGDTKILYLERRDTSFFQGSEPPAFLSMLNEAVSPNPPLAPAPAPTPSPIVERPESSNTIPPTVPEGSDRTLPPSPVN